MPLHVLLTFLELLISAVEPPRICFSVRFAILWGLWFHVLDDLELSQKLCLSRILVFGRSSFGRRPAALQQLPTPNLYHRLHLFCVVWRCGICPGFFDSGWHRDLLDLGSPYQPWSRSLYVSVYERRLINLCRAAVRAISQARRCECGFTRFGQRALDFGQPRLARAVRSEGAWLSSFLYLSYVLS